MIAYGKRAQQLHTLVFASKTLAIIYINLHIILGYNAVKVNGEDKEGVGGEGQTHAMLDRAVCETKFTERGNGSDGAFGTQCALPCGFLQLERT